LPASRESLADVPFLGYERLLNEVKEKHADFIVTGGDNVDPEWSRLPQDEEKLQVSKDTLVAMKRENIERMTQRMKKIDVSVGLPVYYAMGNHDFYGYPLATPEDPLYGQGFFSRCFGHQGQPYYSFDKKGWHFIVLNTYDGNDLNVSVSNKQLDWLTNDLEKIDATTPVIIVSHVPFPIQNGCEEISEAVYGIIKNHNVKLALFGHWHCYHEFVWNGIPCIIGSSASGAVWSLVRNVSDVSLVQIFKGTNQGYLIVHVAGRDVEWDYYPFSYSLEQYVYEKTGQRCSVSYSHSK
jgi:Icc protein